MDYILVFILGGFSGFVFFGFWYINATETDWENGARIKYICKRCKNEKEREPYLEIRKRELENELKKNIELLKKK